MLTNDLTFSELCALYELLTRLHEECTNDEAAKYRDSMQSIKELIGKRMAQYDVRRE